MRFVGIHRALVCAIALATVGLSQVQAATSDNPVLEVESGQQKGAPNILAMGKFDIDVTITGDTARTVVTAQFLNPTNQALEGGFTFDLPANSVVTGYALDVHGTMVDGVLVGKRLATKTYEERVRRGVDPGLAEVTRSGAFKTRVYPILSGNGRTVRLSFVTPIEPGRPFVIPLQTSQAVGNVTLHVKSDAGDSFKVTAPDGVTLHHVNGGFEASAQGQKLAGALSLGPFEKMPAVLLARHPFGETFLEINDAIIPAKNNTLRPERVRIYWDSSLSRRGADLAAEIDLVGRFVAAVQPENIDLVFFSTDEPALRSFHAPSAAEITAVLKTTDYHGGTSLQPLFKSDLPDANTCLLFSDGNMTVDAYKVRRAPCRLSAISSAADANRALLAALAARSGGDHVDLRLEKPEAALARLTSRLPRVIDVKSADGTSADYVLLPAGENRFRLIVRDPAGNAVTVQLAGAAEPTKKYSLEGVAVAEADTLGALWALRHIDDMNATDRPDRDAILALSRQYSVASSEAVFTVFENVQDYVEAKAEPPASAGQQILAAYKQVMKAAAEQQAAAEAERLDHVIELWDAEKSWWKTPVKPVPPKHVSHTLAPPPPPPMMAPAPSPMESDISPNSGSVETMVVTGARVEASGVLETVTLAKSDRAPQGPSIEVKIEPWHPDRPYIKALDAAKPEALWYAYREQEKKFGSIPAFYLDVAEYMFRHGRAQDAVKIVLNALELPSANTTTLVIVADRLMRYGDEMRALWLYERINWLEPDRPQPKRNLALALMGQADHAKTPPEQIAKYRRALNLLNEVVTKVWEGKYDGIEVISLMEANRIIARLKALGVTTVPLDKRLIALLDVDLRIILEWNTDETDMDLWVDEPSGERAIYNHPLTAIGGRLSNDMTNGYGPEQYLLRKAPNGEYVIRTNVFRTDSLDPNGATSVRAHVFRNYGRPNEQEQVLELEQSRGANTTPIIGKVKVSGQHK